MVESITFVDIIFFVLLLIIFYLVGQRIRYTHIQQEPYYKYLIPGMFTKVFGGIAVCIIYIYYYDGGDTVTYFHDNTVLVRLFLIKPLSAIRFSFYPADDQMFYEFNNETDWPYFFFDEHAIYVDKFTWPLSLLTCNSFIGQTMLLSFLSFFAIWRLYKMFVTEFPTLQKGFAFAILFIPSVAFWGSGLLKDTLTISAVALFTSSFYQVIKTKKKIFLNLLLMAITSWMLVKIKPYILFALLPGTIIWLGGYYLGKFDNKLIRAAVTPFLIVVSVILGYLFLDNISSSLGKYSIGNVLEKAVVTQQDLKQDYYHGTSFDIGDFDPTIQSVLLKAPIAIVSALFRPFLWEVNNPAMFISGIENFIMLLFTVYLLIRLRIYYFFKLLFKNHLLFFCVSFSLFFAFSVGLSTSNFGSLVRYKIPAIPFFIASLLITNHYYQLQIKNRKEKLKL